MNEFVVVIFPSEAKAYEGVHALQELHAEASVTVFGTVVVQREANGTLSIKQRSDEGPVGFGVGALVGGLIGMFGGPAGAALGMAGGGLIGTWRDYLHAEVSDDFLEELARELEPGRLAVVAEVSEEWTAPIDTRMEQLGGRVVREWREDFVDDLIGKRVDRRRTELERRKAEHASAKAERMDARLRRTITDAEAKLQAAAEQARQRLENTKVEMDAKLKALEAQAAKAKPDIKSRVEQRIASIRKDFGERAEKLRRAYELTQEAIRA